MTITTLYYRAKGDTQWQDAAELNLTRNELQQLKEQEQEIEVREDVRVVAPVEPEPVMPREVGAAWERWARK